MDFTGEFPPCSITILELKAQQNIRGETRSPLRTVRETVSNAATTTCCSGHRTAQSAEGKARSLG